MRQYFMIDDSMPIIKEVPTSMPQRWWVENCVEIAAKWFEQVVQWIANIHFDQTKGDGENERNRTF